MTTNPYSAPAAKVADPAAPEGRFIVGGRTVAAGRGWDWFVAAWSLFRRQPGVWIAIFAIFAAFTYLSTRIDFVGGLALTLFAPVFGAGIVIGSRTLDQGDEIRVGHLFAGFRERFGALLGVGALYLVASFLAGFIALVIAGGSVIALAQGGKAPGGDWMALLASIALFLLVLMALSVPVLMAVWFAPALVAVHDRGPLEAMKESFQGCLKNALPFLIYGLVGLVAAVVAAIPFGLGWLVFGPVLMASVYTAYKDIYLEP
jgi:uncharacterized membrane protein